MNAPRSIANADRIENISKQTMYVEDNRQQYSRQVPFTLSSRPVEAQSNCGISRIQEFKSIYLQQPIHWRYN